MKFLPALLFVGLITVDANSGLRGDIFPEVEQFACERNGSGGKTQCDASKADDGSSCVWCELSSFGACVSKDQAGIMEDKIPGLSCDGGDDDDNSGTEDDDSAAEDDDSGGEYWKCLKKGSNSEKDCENTGCSWCDTKAGYGICLDKQSAEAASKSDWFDCKLEFQNEITEKEVAPTDPYDTSCILATLEGDEKTCESTLDSGGQACEWCSFTQPASAQVCLTSDQAAIAEQALGADCDATFQTEILEEEVEEEEAAPLIDPYDTSCLLATLEGDETTCESTLDSDGQSCEWCSFSQSGSSVQLCLTSDQGSMAEQLGAECDTTLLSVN